MKITIVAGARPNFMKISPIIDALEEGSVNKTGIQYRLVHTGQHYDSKMSDSFFNELGIPTPHVNLDCGGGTQAEQTANIMVKFEQDLEQNKTDLLLVVGDVTSTMACTIVAKKMGVPVAHVEAGIRSNDMTMPEEINRIVTDSITDYFFTTSQRAGLNLRASGVDAKQIFFVGNTMIDTLLKHQHRFTQPDFWRELKLSSGKYFVLTLHRPSNVDDMDALDQLLTEITGLTRGLKIVFPVHPRTQKKLDSIAKKYEGLYLVEPQSYLRFNYMVSNSMCVITDSGGITEETTILGIPCITLRDSTERPETVEVGSNVLVGRDFNLLKKVMNDLFSLNWKKGSVPEKWDGKASQRIVTILQDLI